MKMIIDVLMQLNIKPSKESVEYADSFIKSNGGYQKYIKEYKKRKAPKAPRSEDISKSIGPITQDQRAPTSNMKSYSTTPNSLKPPSRPPPKPPVYQSKVLPISNQLQANISQSSFLSPRSALVPTYITPEKNQTGALNSQAINSPVSENSRNALMKSIENFKGGLKHVDNNQNQLHHSDTNSDIMSQLFKALGEMRPYLSSLLFFLF